MHRLADGITSSLRQFSTAQRLCTPPADSNSNNDRNGNSSARHQAAANALNEIIAMTEDSADQLRSQTRDQNDDQQQRHPPRQQFSSSFSQAPVIASLPRGGLRGRGFGAQGGGFRGAGFGNRGGGNFAFGRGGFGRGDSDVRAEGDVQAEGDGPHIIRGGFRGRGGFGFRGRGAGRGRGRGGRGGRGGRRNQDGEDGEGSKKRRKDKDKDKDPDFITQEEREFFTEQAEGEEKLYNPSLELESLAGYLPAVPLSSSNLARSAIVMRQMRVLGGGEPYHHDAVPEADDVNARFRWGSGVFFPTEKAREASLRNVSDDLASRLKSWAATPGGKDPALNTAIITDSLRGVYDGPQYANPDDASGTIRNYVRRDGTWTPAAERMMLAKFESLDPSSKSKAQEAAGGAAATSDVNPTRSPGRGPSRDMPI